MTYLYSDFGQGLDAHWQTSVVGSSRLELTGGTLRLVNANAPADCYSNAQIDDYRGLPRRRFLWSPPLTLTVRARFSHGQPGLPADLGASDRPAPFTGALPQRAASAESVQAGDSEKHAAPHILLGTAGFGFWNDPFAMTERRVPTLPRALWFFYASPPSDMKLDLNTPGYGWKAATIDAARWPFVLLAPTIPVSVPLMHVEAAHRRLWPIGQRAIGVSEALVPADMTAWHTYVIEWGVTAARFLVDRHTVLDCATSPKGPLGLVIWIDNQTMVVTPQGRLRHGLLAKPGEQWLELATLTVSSPANVVKGAKHEGRTG